MEHSGTYSLYLGYMTPCLKKTAMVQALLTLRYVNVDKQMNQLNLFLLYCEKYAESRKVMMDIVRDLVSATKSKQSLKITEHLLLAPYCDDIRKRDNMFIKEALFEFISSCNRNI